jgi:hypothetical protein
MSPHAATPDRLIDALTAAGWVEEGRRAGTYVRLTFLEHESSLLVPLDPTAPEYAELMAGTWAELERLARLGDAAGRALTEAVSLHQPQGSPVKCPGSGQPAE